MRKFAFFILILAMYGSSASTISDSLTSMPLVPVSAALSSAFVIPGVYVSYNSRDGCRKFDGFSDFQHVENTNPFMIGGYVGKRIRLDNPRWRIQTGADVSWGTVKDFDVDVNLTNGDEITAWVHSTYLTGGIIAEAQFLMTGYEQTTYLFFGPGVHASRFNASYKTESGRHIHSALDNRYRMRYSLSANLGIGAERMIGNRRAVAFGYAFRFWQTARYIETGLFPMGADYREFFCSHALFLHILAPGLRGGNKFQ